MSKSNSGVVTPNIKKCINEILSIFVNDNNKDGANDVVVDVLLDYLFKNERTKLMVWCKPG